MTESHVPVGGPTAGETPPPDDEPVTPDPTPPDDEYEPV